MTQADLEREVAHHTGETVALIRRNGFSLLETKYPPPRVVDWDRLDQQRLGILPARPQRRRLARC